MQKMKIFEKEQLNKYKVLALITCVYILQIILAILSSRVNATKISDNFMKRFIYIF